MTTPLRLRIPAALAVAAIGTAAAIALSFGGCEHEPLPPEPTDAGQLSQLGDAEVDGGELDSAAPDAGGD